MPLDMEHFSEPVAAVLTGYPDVRLPLVKNEMREHPQLDSMARQSARELFPGARDPESAHSGLLLLLGGWQQAHETAQEIARREGSYWHAILHRMEPDIFNAGYWFRRVGSHPIFEDLRSGAEAMVRQDPDIQWTVRDRWDPIRFLDFFEKAAADKSGASHRVAAEIQSLEWRLLFEWCSARSGD
jgi:hypothetical protein